jgi:hypothetical protein
VMRGRDERSRGRTVGVNIYKSKRAGRRGNGICNPGGGRGSHITAHGGWFSRSRTWCDLWEKAKQSLQLAALQVFVEGRSG